MLQTIANAFAIPEIRRKIAFTLAMLLLYRLGAYIPAPGVDIDTVESIEDNFTGNNILGFLNLFSGGSLQRLSLFALGIMPYITASIILQLLTVVVPGARAPAEGGRGRPAEDHPVHALPHRRRSPSASRSATSSCSRASRTPPATSVVGELTFGKVFLIVISLTAGMHAADVARRADHPARDRQRDQPDDLRLDRRRDRPRDLELVEQPRPGLRRDDAVRRARGDRRHRLRPGGPAADPGAVRQTRRRPPDDDRRLDLPAAAGEHGRRDPGHLRRLDHGLPADDRPAAQHPGGARLRRLLQPPTAGPTSSARSSSSSSSPTSTRRSPSTRSTRPTT